MTDLNTQMTQEAMMQAEIEKSARDYNDLRDALDRTVHDLNEAIARAEKAERETAELRAQTDALIAAAGSYLAYWSTDCETDAEFSLNTALHNAIKSTGRTPADAKAALEARDRAMRNEGRRQAARFVAGCRDTYIQECGIYDPSTGVTEFPGNGDETVEQWTDIEEGILSLIEKEPEGKGDE